MMELEPTTEHAPRTEQRLRMTYDEFLAWADADTHAEWVDGEVIVFMPPLTIHRDIAFWLGQLIALYVELFRLGRVLVAPYEMQIHPEGRSREPDVLFVAQAHQERIQTSKLAGPADLVVEVISDASVYRDRVDKFTEYAAGGVQEYWLIDPRPKKQRLDVYWRTLAGTYQSIVPDNAGRYHSQVLPGFWLHPAWLWQEPLPDLLLTLAEIRGLSPKAAQALRTMLGATQ